MYIGQEEQGLVSDCFPTCTAGFSSTPRMLLAGSDTFTTFALWLAHSCEKRKFALFPGQQKKKGGGFNRFTCLFVSKPSGSLAV